MTSSIKSLIDLYPNHTYVITSRPETGLLAFPHFKIFKIRPLEREESFALIRKYDEGSEKLEGGSSGRAEQLISKLQGPDFRAVHEFLRNPLLTSLLYRSFEYKQSVPLKKHVFYRQVFDALFDWHDATKDGYNTREKKSGLDIDSFHRMLRVVGFLSVMKGQVEGDTDTVLGWIRKAKEVCNLPGIPESNFLDDLRRAVPVFVKDGDQYRWSHKSLSEYFAAQYLCTEGKGQQGIVLEKLVESKKIARFMNVLDQVYDVDIAGFRQHLILPIARAFNAHWNTTYKAIDVRVPDEQVRLRRAVTFDIKGYLLNRFEGNKDVRQFILDKIGATGDSSALDNPVNFLLVRPVQSRATVQLFLTVHGPMSSVLSILRMKKDPLVLSYGKISSLVESSRAPKLPTKDAHDVEVMDDDPRSRFNVVENFSTVTRILVEQIPTVDAEAMLRFELSFNHESMLDSMTDELLRTMSGEISR